jgi:hypothetical protein
LSVHVHRCYSYGRKPLQRRAIIDINQYVISSGGWALRRSGVAAVGEALAQRRRAIRSLLPVDGWTAAAWQWNAVGQVDEVGRSPAAGTCWRLRLGVEAGWRATRCGTGCDPPGAALTASAGGYHLRRPVCCGLDASLWAHVVERHVISVALRAFRRVWNDSVAAFALEGRAAATLARPPMEHWGNVPAVKGFVRGGGGAPLIVDRPKVFQGGLLHTGAEADGLRRWTAVRLCSLTHR